MEMIFPIRRNEAVKRIRQEKFGEFTRQYMDSPDVQQMDNFMQHGNTTTLEHCRNVAWVSFLMNEKLHINAKEDELIEAAMLHDFYLYDWHDGNRFKKKHGFIHPYIASDNAARIFGCSEDIRAAIKSHMWPLNIREVPRSKEAVIICLADKYCAIVETLGLCRIG